MGWVALRQEVMGGAPQARREQISRADFAKFRAKYAIPNRNMAMRNMLLFRRKVQQGQRGARGARAALDY